MTDPMVRFLGVLGAYVVVRSPLAGPAEVFSFCEASARGLYSVHLNFATEYRKGEWRMNKNLLGAALILPLLLAGCATDSHFGVADKAAHVPDWITAHTAGIARAEASAGAQICPDKMARAKKYAKQAMAVYWACHDGDARVFLNEASKLAAEVEACSAPVAVARPAAARPLELSAEVLFAFDQADLSPRGAAILDQFLHDLGSAAYSGVLIVGHTDPKGSEAYNQRLSERRAQAVAGYLTGHGVPQQRIRAQGRGERELRVTYQQCAAQGARNHQSLIDCYQPNRRATVSAKIAAPAAASPAGAPAPAASGWLR